jgi:hypothetical protein
VDYFNIKKHKENNVLKLRKCVKKQKYDIIRLHVGYVVKGSEASYKLNSGKKFTGHSSQIILDLNSKKAFILESSINQGSIGRHFEYIKEESLEVFLKEYLDPDFRVEPIDFQSCPSVNLQGKSELCATWSLYLFLLYILNPGLNRTKIYKIFNEYTQEERDKVILQFLYYLHSLKLVDTIPGLSYFAQNVPLRKKYIPNLSKK